MSQYCNKCGGLHTPVEMDVKYEGIRHTVYQCPRCQSTRKVSLNLFRNESVENVSMNEAQEVSKSGRKLGLGAVVVGGLLAIVVAALTKEE